MNNWYDDLLVEEKPPESTNWYDQLLEDKPQEPSATGWYDKMLAKPEDVEEKPELSWGGTAKEMLKPSPAIETTAHLGYGMASWIPSKISGLGQIGLQKITNKILEDATKDERRSPEEKEILRQKGFYSPEKIREMAEQSEALWQILPPPESKEAKFVLEKVGKGLDWALTHFRVADEYYTKEGYPNLGYALRFVGELLFFKAAHGLGVKSTAKLKKLRKKVVKEAPATEIKESLDDVLDEMKIEKEGITPKADTLKEVTKSQKMRAHKIAKEKGFTEAERGDLAEKITGKRSMMDMNRESAREFIEVLKRGKERPVEVKIEDLREVPLTEKEIVIEPKEVKDAGRIREEVREAGEEVRIEREEERPLRVRDAEKDRLEAREREAKEEIAEARAERVKEARGEEPPLRPELAEKVHYEGIQESAFRNPVGEIDTKPTHYTYTNLKGNSTFHIPLEVTDLNKAVAAKLVEMDKVRKAADVVKAYRGEFKPAGVQISTDYGYWGKGKYYSLEKKVAQRYAKGADIQEVSIDTSNFAKMSVSKANSIKSKIAKDNPDLTVKEVAEQFGDDLRKKGYDGFILEGKDQEIVVYSSEKVKTISEDVVKSEVKPEPPSEAVKTLISDDIRTAEDMGLYADIKEMIGKKKKVGEIMKELKQKAYYEEDLKDFGYTEKDIRESIRAIKAETGDKTAIKQIQSVLKVEEKKVAKITEVEKRVPPEKEPVPEVKEEPIVVPKEIDEVRARWEQEQVPLKNEEGRILKSKVFAMKRMKELGQTGELVKNPKGEGWLLKRERPSAEERRAEEKEWEEVLREEELGEIGEEGLGERVDIGVDEIFNPFGSEEGALKIFKGIYDKISDVKKKMEIKKSRTHLTSLLSKRDLNRVERKNTVELGSSILKQSSELKNTKYSDNIKRYDKNYVVITDDGNTFIPGSSTLGETLSSFNHPDFDSFGYSFSKLKNDNVIAKLRKEYLSGLIDKNEYRRARSTIGLSDDIKLDIDHLWGEKGAITFDFESIKKLKDLIKKGFYSREEIIAGLKSRGAVDKDINKLFSAVSVRIPIGESKWLKKGQSPLEFLPARTVGKTKEGRVLKAPAVTREDAHIVATTTDLPSDVGAGLKKAPIGEKLRWAPSEGIFTQLGKPLREVFYRRMIKAHKKSSDYAKELLKEDRKLNETFSLGSRELHSERLSIYETAQQPDGVVRLKLQGVTKIPKLTSKEKIVYEARQDAYKKLYVEINKARIATGKRSFPPIENYTMWAHDMSKLKDFERISAFDKMEKIQSGLDRIRDIPSQIDKLGRTVSLKGHEKLRAGPDMPGYLILDSAENYKVYAKLAADVIHESESIAYMHELLTGKFELSKNAPNTHKFLSQWLDFQKGHEPIMFIENAKARRLMRTFSSNVAVAYLTYQIRPTIVQLASLSLSYAKLGGRFTGEGAVRLLSPFEIKRAARESNILTTRTPEEILIEAQRVYPFFKSLKGKTVVKGWAKTKRVGSRGLLFTDSIVSYLTWLGAEAKGKALYKKLPKDQQQAISIKDFSKNYADDITVQCQGSAAKAARSPLQRHAEGKLMTTLGTFTIANFDFITRHLMGIRNPDITKPQAVASAMRFVLASTIISSIFSDVLQLTSPIPTPVDAFRESLETDPDFKKAFQAAVTELLEFIPIYGGKYKFDSELMGPVVDQLIKLGKGDYSSLGRLGGMPGYQALWKAYRAERQGGTAIDIIMGRYLEPRKSLTAPIGGRKSTDLLTPIEP